MISKAKINYALISFLLICCGLVACSPLHQLEHDEVTWYQVGAIDDEAQGKIGDKIEKSDISVSVTSFEEGISFGEYVAKEGNKFIGIEIEVQCHLDECEVSLLFARIQDANKNVFFVPVYIGKLTFGEKKNHITKGEIAKGWVAYEVPETSDSLLFIYEDFRSPDTERVLISLEK